MSTLITRSPTENRETIKDLLIANLFEVFGQRDRTVRYTTIGRIYHRNIVWYEPDRVIHDWEAIDKRAGEILAEAPGFQFSIEGEPIITQNLGVVNWNFGPNEDSELVKGTDIVLVEGGKIKALWTAMTKTP
ncbi:hypothetical protein BP6252_13383 [Coleophoma cylindrospora]|uniref:SnoaL-like domain-containing protein n=1 Tax=Coleophoma cylindrospora TaxID=1849047 RepID=A0A3D8QB31_9HELO|nr:hypothetical protein BP6252_13383 [Coleophoma cylindrospora]